MVGALMRKATAAVCKVLERRRFRPEAAPWRQLGRGPSSASQLLELVMDLGGLPKLLQQRSVAALAFSEGPEPALVACLPPSLQQLPLGDRLRLHGVEGKGVLAIWSLARPDRPSALLLCEGSPSCCCWGAGAVGGTVVVAGTEEGAVYLWDIGSLASTPADAAEVLEGARLHRPTLTSEFGAGTGHTRPIVSVACSPPGAEQRHRQRQGPAALGLSQASAPPLVHLAVLDESGCTSLWDLRDPGSRGIGSRPATTPLQLLLVQGASPLGVGHLREEPPVSLDDSMELGTDSATAAFPLLARAMALCGDGRTDLLVGTSDGTVLRGSRRGALLAPAEYLPGEPSQRVEEEEEAGAVVDLPWGQVPGSRPEVTSIAACPSKPGTFAAGTSDGGVHIFELSSSTPVSSGHVGGSGRRIRAMAWSATKPSIVALDAAGLALHYLGGDLIAQERLQESLGESHAVLAPDMLLREPPPPPSPQASCPRP